MAQREMQSKLAEVRRPRWSTGPTKGRRRRQTRLQIMDQPRLGFRRRRRRPNAELAPKSYAGLSDVKWKLPGVTAECPVEFRRWSVATW